MSNISKQISHFLSAAPSYKFVVAPDEWMLENLSVFDLGFNLATLLKENDKFVKEDISFIIQDELTRLFYQNINTHTEFGDYICLSNIGILFEKELNINVLQTFQRLSRNTLVILQWEGEIKGSTLFFLSENSKHKIDLREINHIIIS
jgi:hypothetical protein